MAFAGSWKLDRSEGMGEMVAAMGLPADKVPSSPAGFSLVIEQTGNKFVISATTPQGTRKNEFTVGEPMKEQIMGVEVDATSKIEGGKLVIETGKGNSLTREIVNGELVTTISFEGISAKRIFVKA